MHENEMEWIPRTRDKKEAQPRKEFSRERDAIDIACDAWANASCREGIDKLAT